MSRQRNFLNFPAVMTRIDIFESEEILMASLFRRNPQLDALVGKKDTANQERHAGIQYRSDIVSRLAEYISFDMSVDPSLPTTHYNREKYECALQDLTDLGLNLPSLKSLGEEKLRMLLSVARDYVVSRQHLAEVAKTNYVIS